MDPAGDWMIRSLLFLAPSACGSAKRSRAGPALAQQQCAFAWPVREHAERAQSWKWWMESSPFFWLIRAATGSTVRGSPEAWGGQGEQGETEERGVIASYILLYSNQLSVSRCCTRKGRLGARYRAQSLSAFIERSRQAKDAASPLTAVQASERYSSTQYGGSSGDAASHSTHRTPCSSSSSALA